MITDRHGSPQSQHLRTRSVSLQRDAVVDRIAPAESKVVNGEFETLITLVIQSAIPTPTLHSANTHKTPHLIQITIDAFKTSLSIPIR